MALKKTVFTPHGFEATDAYHRVEGVRVEKTHIKFQLRSYKESGSPHFFDEEFTSGYDMDGENPMAQAYAHLKNLPEFAGAIDC